MNGFDWTPEGLEFAVTFAKWFAIIALFIIAAAVLLAVACFAVSGFRHHRNRQSMERNFEEIRSRLPDHARTRHRTRFQQRRELERFATNIDPHDNVELLPGNGVEFSFNERGELKVKAIRPKIKPAA